jgi:hypothetical protein
MEARESGAYSPLFFNIFRSVERVSSLFNYREVDLEEEQDGWKNLYQQGP